jgi:hypothetical protein
MEDFFFHFEQTAHRAGYKDRHEGYLISLLERNMSAPLVDKVYQTTPLPRDYGQRKAKLIELDQLWCRCEERKRFAKELWSKSERKEEKGKEKSRPSPLLLQVGKHGPARENQWRLTEANTRPKVNASSVMRKDTSQETAPAAWGQ